MNRRLKMYMRVCSPLLALLAFAVYFVTLSRGAFPGDSASLIAYHAQIDPFDTLLQPVWGVWVRLIALIPLGELAFRLNLFSAICGALSVGLLFVVGASIPHTRTTEEGRAYFSASRTQALSGLVAALFFAFSVPFWTVSTRAHYLTFDVLFLLICTWLFMQIWQQKSRKLLYLFMVLYGIGMVQSSAFILAAPFFGLLLLFRLWQRDMLTWRMFFTLLAFGLLGLLVFVPAAIRFYMSPAYEWRGLDGFFNLLWILVRDQGRTALRAVRQAGWMLIFLTTVLPWFVVVAVTKTSTRDRTGRVGSLLLHIVVTGIGVILLYNISPSPMAVLADGSQLAFAYLLAAVWLGYVAGYWYAIIPVRRPDESGTAQGPAWGGALRGVWVVILAAALGTAAVRNAPLADGRQAAPLQTLAQAIVDGMGDRSWLISNGLLDANIQIAAAQRGKEIRVLNPRLAGIPAYMRYVASLMDNVRLKGMAELGMAPLLSEWLATDPDVAEQLSILASPEIWVEAGYYPVPRIAVFNGAEEPSIADADAYVQRHQMLWDALKAYPVDAPDQPAGRYVRWARQHVSKVANNAGVYLEDQGHTDQAFTCYAAARELDDRNVSALMNQLSLANREERPEVEQLDEDLEQFLEGRERQMNLWALSETFGYIRDPQAYVRQGMAWALSGRLRTAVSDVERAIAITGSKNPQLQHMLAALYVRGDRLEEGEEVYRQLLAENPDDVDALVALYRSAIMGRDPVAANEYRQRLAAHSDVPEGALVVEDAMLALLEGDRVQARARLDGHLQNNPENARAWGMLVILAEQEADEALMTRALTALNRINNPAPELLSVKAQAQIFLRYLPAARETLNHILRRNPRHTHALEQLLRLDVMEGDQSAATRHVERLLAIDPGNALGNYILGTIQAARHDFALAENSMRRSLERREMPEALNDLAWLLHLRGAHDEAYPLVSRSLERNPRNPNAWSTYGVILMERGQLEEASEALHRALQLQPGHPLFQLNLATLYERMDMPREALSLIDEVQASISSLPERDAQRAIALSTRLRSK